MNPNFEVMYKLLLLEAELRGYPHLAASRALVNQALVDMEADAQKAAAKIAFDKQAAAAREAAQAAAQAEAAQLHPLAPMACRARASPRPVR